MVCDIWSVDLDPLWSVSVRFQGSLLVIEIVIDGNEKRSCKLDLKLQSSHVI